jgi:hypothetical protein
MTIIERSNQLKQQRCFCFDGGVTGKITPLICCEESFGRLVLLGFDVTTFTPVTYQRSSLLRPYKEVSSRG